MKLNNLNNVNVTKALKITDLENVFNIYQDKNGQYFFNLNNTVIFNIDEDCLIPFTLSHNMHWPLISYNIYGTTRLAWVLMKLNNVKPAEIFDMKIAGDVVMYVNKDYLQAVIQEINRFNF